MATLMLARSVATLPRRTAQLARAPSASSRPLSSSSLPEPYDVVIVGGGPAGLSLAAALGS
jgi:NADPH-dependent 2,4-dienoyl-CoA reductase/sulfur reductase-like enzyme